MNDTIINVLEKLPPEHPVAQWYRYYFKNQREWYDDLQTLTSESLTKYAHYIINNHAFYPNYLKTFVYVTALRLNEPTIRPRITRNDVHAYSFDVGRTINFGLAINDHCRARVVEGFWEFIYPFHATWIKQYPIVLHSSTYSVHQFKLRLFASPDINDYWNSYLNHSDDFDIEEPLALIASNPWITPATVYALSNQFIEYPHYMDVLIKYIAQNEALSLEFIDEWGKYLLNQPLVSYNKNYLLNELGKMVCRRSDCPRAIIEQVDPESKQLYPQSTAEDIERFVARLPTNKLKAFHHPNCSQTLKDKILKTKQAALLFQLLSYNGVHSLYRLKYLPVYPKVVNIALLTEHANEKYKKAVEYVLSKAVSPETFFIKSSDQFLHMIDEVTSFWS